MRLPLNKVGSSIGRLVLWALLALSFSGCSGCTEENDKTIDLFDRHEYGEWEYDGEPDIDGEQTLVFGDVLEGETVEQLVEVSNVGNHLLKISGLSVDGPFEFGDPRSRFELRPGETFEVGISYTARNTDRAEGSLWIESNDPDEPVFEIDLFANADFPCLELAPADQVDFGVSELGETHSRDIIATNCAERSPTSFEVAAVDGASEFSLLDENFEDEVELEPGASVRIPIGFQPETPGRYEGAVYVNSDDEFEPSRVIELSGQGRPYECPEAVIRAYNPDRGEAIADPRGRLQAVPLDDIALDASLSHDPEESGISRVEWRLVERPPGSTADIAGADRTAASMWMQLAGTYVVELDVWNEVGVQSCEPARMTLEAISDEDIHVQLVWSTPADPNETDRDGTDLDLHFLHPIANDRWDNAPWDCFWQNKTPDWGEPGRVDDDPSLDIDDIDGAGPENINLDNPENNTTYSVGVYYFSDSGSSGNFGRSYATVRIYIGGALAFEHERKAMENEDFWRVADIGWPAGEINELNQLYRGFP